MREVTFLLAPNKYSLYLDEILDYAEEHCGLSVQDLGLKVVREIVDCDDSWQAVKIAAKRLYDRNKGYTFIDVGVTW